MVAKYCLPNTNYLISSNCCCSSRRGFSGAADRVKVGECTLYPVGTVFALGNIVPVETEYLLQITVLACFETMFEMVESIGGFLFAEL